MNELHGKCAIVGVGETGETKVGHVPGVTARSHALQAAKKAIEDADLSNTDIDGVLTRKSFLDPIFGRNDNWVMKQQIAMHGKTNWGSEDFEYLWSFIKTPIAFAMAVRPYTSFSHYLKPDHK